MALLEWRDEFATGIPSIDYEHRNLIGLINDLHTRAMRNPDKGPVEDTLGDIHANISAHFALEEKVMRDLDYPQYDSHKAEHEALLDDIRAIMDKVHADREFDYRTSLADCLRDWFGDHFKGADSRLHRQTGH